MEEARKKEIEDAEKAYLQNKVAHEKAMEEERLKLEALKRKKCQQDILHQISNKDEDKKRTVQQKMLDKREAIMTELEYQKKVSIENNKNTDRLEQIKTQSSKFKK